MPSAKALWGATLILLTGCTSNHISTPHVGTKGAGQPPAVRVHLLIAQASSDALADYELGHERWKTTDLGQPQSVVGLGRGYVALLSSQRVTRAIFFLAGSTG